MRRIAALSHLRLLRFAQPCTRRAALRAALRKSGSDLARRHAGKACAEPFLPRTRVYLTLEQTEAQSTVQTFLHRARVSSCVTVNSLVIHLMSEFLHRARTRLA